MPGTAIIMIVVVVVLVANSLKVLAKNNQDAPSGQESRRQRTPKRVSMDTAGAPSIGNRYSEQNGSSDEEPLGTHNPLQQEQDNSPEDSIAAQTAPEAKGVQGYAPTPSPAGTVSGGMTVTRKNQASLRSSEIKRILSSPKTAKMGFILSEILGSPKSKR